MTSIPKAQKEKPHVPAGRTTPRPMPRPTAASAARAARNATNRNLSQSQWQSPTRPGGAAAVGASATGASNSSIKTKGPVPRVPSKCDSKSDLKLSRNPEIESPEICSVPPSPEMDTYIVDQLTVEATEEINHGKVIDYENAVILEVNESETFDEQGNGEQRRDYGNENPDELADQMPDTWSHSPAMASRPQTPKSLQSSRPQTPFQPSRPTTPVHPHHASRPSTPVHQHHPSPASRPNTPRVPTPNRQMPQTGSANMAAPHERIQATNSLPSPPKSPISEDDDIKAVYSMKQKQFLDMKKELDLKQQAVLEVFECLRRLRERMTQEGLSGSGEGIPHQELVVFNVADWPTDEVAQLCRTNAIAVDSGAADILNDIVPFDERAFAEVDANMTKVPARFADLCLQAFTTRQEIIDWVKDLVERHEENGNEALDRIARYNAQGLELCEALRSLKNCADNAVETISQFSRRACQERSTLMAVGESLVREVALLRQDLEVRTAAITELQQARNKDETMKLLEDARRELEEERAARITAKDKLSTTESQLRQTRMRISKMDRQLREAEASISSLTGTVKALEDQVQYALIDYYDLA